MEPAWKLKKVTLFVHGACTTDRVGPGGWACRLHCKDVVSETFGCNPQSTANQMALRAAIEGLRAIKQRCFVTVHTNCEYLYKGMTKWLANWKTNGWQTESGQVKNQELWKELGDAAAQHIMRWRWMKPDSPDVAEHQICEKLAMEAAVQQISSPLVRKSPVGTAINGDPSTSSSPGEKIAVQMLRTVGSTVHVTQLSLQQRKGRVSEEDDRV